MRIITQSDYYAHTNPLFKQLNILKFEELFMYASQVYMYKTIVLDKYPILLRSILENQINHNYATRINNLRLPYCRIHKATKKLSYQITKNWNSLPQHIKNVESLNAFKRNCKSFHINKY